MKLHSGSIIKNRATSANYRITDVKNGFVICVSEDDPESTTTYHFRIEHVEKDYTLEYCAYTAAKEWDELNDDYQEETYSSRCYENSYLTDLNISIDYNLDEDY